MPVGSRAELLGAPCRVRGVLVGEVTAVIVDAEVTRAIGLDIRSPDDVHRFLPWVAAEVDGDGVDVSSAFLLVDAGDSYTRRGARAIVDASKLADLRVEADGRITDGVAVSIGARAGTSSR